MLKFGIKALCALSLTASTVYAYNVTEDYSQAIKHSVEQSPQYKYIGYQLNSRQMEPAIKLGALLPSVDIGGSVSEIKIVSPINSDRDFIRKDGSYEAMQGLISLTQPIYDYGAYKNLRSSEEGALFAQQDYRTSYQQFLYDVTYAYFNLAKALKNIEYTSYNRKAAEANLKELEQKYKIGVVDMVDYETSKSNFYLAEADYISAKRDAKVARAELHKFTDNYNDIVFYDNEFELKDPNPSSEEEWQLLAMRSNPSYLGSIHTKESKFYDYESVTSKFMPKINFEIKFAPGFNQKTPLGNPALDRFLPASGTVNAFYFGLTAEWNILDGGTNFAELKQAAYDYQSSEFDMIQTGRVAQNDAMYAYRFVEYKKNEIESLRKSVSAAKIAYEKYKDKYESGTTTITQYFILLNKYYQYLIDLNNAEFDYILGFISLYKTAGILTNQVVQEFNDWILYGQNVEL